MYYFVLYPDRSGFDITSTVKEEGNRKGLEDPVADTPIESQGVTSAKGFEGRITDIETGPDGNLYVLTYFDGRIYRIFSILQWLTCKDLWIDAFTAFLKSWEKVFNFPIIGELSFMLFLIWHSIMLSAPQLSYFHNATETGCL